MISIVEDTAAIGLRLQEIQRERAAAWVQQVATELVVATIEDPCHRHVYNEWNPVTGVHVLRGA